MNCKLAANVQFRESMSMIGISTTHLGLNIYLILWIDLLKKSLLRYCHVYIIMGFVECLLVFCCFSIEDFNCSNLWYEYS